jgi:ABC-2 type transport system permease protein
VRRSLSLETGAEVLKALRAPEYLLPTLLMPVAFYSLFALALPSGGGAPAYLLATYGVFAVLGPSVMGFGIGAAQERESGWLELKRAGPSPWGSYILAKTITTAIFSVFSLAAIYLAAAFGGGVALSKPEWLLLLGVHLSMVLPFVLVGMVLGFSLSPNAAVAFANLVFLGLAAIGGLWIPIGMMPGFLQAAAVYLPTYHAGEIALAVVGTSTFDPLNMAALGVMTAVLGAAALAASRRKTR